LEIFIFGLYLFTLGLNIYIWIVLIFGLKYLELNTEMKLFLSTHRRYQASSSKASFDKYQERSVTKSTRRLNVVCWP